MGKGHRSLESTLFLAACVLSLLACKKKEGDKCSSPSDCASGLFCVDPDSTGGVCMTPAQGATACRSSKDCAANGRCTLDNQYGNCLAKTDADCSGSKVCKEQGDCTASGAGYCKK